MLRDKLQEYQLALKDKTREIERLTKTRRRNGTVIGTEIETGIATGEIGIEVTGIGIVSGIETGKGRENEKGNGKERGKERKKGRGIEKKEEGKEMKGSVKKEKDRVKVWNAEMVRWTDRDVALHQCVNESAEDPRTSMKSGIEVVTMRSTRRGDWSEYVKRRRLRTWRS